MKNKYACSVAAIILAFLLATVILNIIYVNNTFDEIFTRLDASTTIEDLRDISEYWEKRRRVLGFSLSEPELDKISLCFEELIINAEESDEEEYKRSAARLRRAADDIRDLEDLTLDNIF